MNKKQLIWAAVPRHAGHHDDLQPHFSSPKHRTSQELKKGVKRETGGAFCYPPTDRLYLTNCSFKNILKRDEYERISRNKVSFFGQVDAEASTASSSAREERMHKDAQDDGPEVLQPAGADQNTVGPGTNHPVRGRNVWETFEH